MFKKVASVIALGTALSPALVIGADDARSAIHIEANIPTQQFHVQPRDPEFGKDEVMHYDPVNKRFSLIRQTYDVKNTEGSIHGYLQEGRPSLTNGTDELPLLVRFNNVSLNHIPQEVVDDASSTPGTQAQLVIQVSAVPLDSQVGLYTGDLTLIFDAVPRVNP
ncbi:CS1 type fimbrial major subunit [Pseudomonas sp. NFIX10]|uniref:CS1 type fimbrial major subunit n=1 Tax=unclassified Pseudomonas TaxID=196821 RepID=UPI0008F3A95D|nr:MULTISPECIES: CS1 type fimbrial major subunit [unclassified Pseudomonas]SFA77974.1 CS1 type fimbrial major subunit [Pseudomonas sp. NFIX10]SFE12833.1 CS1 type fimbrial major subunit [Pseudomonas sp. NFACC06-1]